MALSHQYKKAFCWNGCDETLCKCIERSKFVKNVRKQLMEKKLKKHLTK